MMRTYQRLPIAIRRVLFLAAHALVVLAIHGVAIQPWLDRRRGQLDQIADLDGQLQRLKRLAARGQQAEDQLARARSQSDGGVFWKGDNEAAVSAAIQAAVRDFAGDGRLKLRSIRGIQTQTTDGAPRGVQVRIEAYGDYAAVHRFLTSVEQATPFLFGHALAIRSSMQTSPSAAPSEPLLELQLDVVGYRRQGQT
jgi:GAF domain-containing protein